MNDCKPRGVPADPFSHLIKNSSANEIPFPYREAVGSLMFTSICTRPDISFAVNQVAQFSKNPNQIHWEAARRIIVYFIGSADQGINYTGNGESILTAYTDVDFTGDVNGRRSTMGNIFLINGGAVALSSQRQKCVALSTTETEYVAANMATEEIAWLRSLLKDIGCKQDRPTRLLCDNQSTIRLMRNPEFHQHTKHIDVKYHYIRNMQEEGAVNVTYVKTTSHLANGLTKTPNEQKISKFKFDMSMCSRAVI
ncbi:secreted RxLR effector protein 161-like [Daphnia magna]|uniref:secreted RxLR effector protein 161-like n=1 Tax=Daphnia magna TaxID=35525 RepID=UPI001403ACE0|nr:secreted RxLR effector protein 161-like [Daphnia magna]